MSRTSRRLPQLQLVGGRKTINQQASVRLGISYTRVCVLRLSRFVRVRRCSFSTHSFAGRRARRLVLCARLGSSIFHHLHLAVAFERRHSSTMFSGFTPFGQPKKEHAAKCDCGCVPAIMSLHEQAKARAARRRAAADQATNKPTVAQYLATQGAPPVPPVSAMAAAAAVLEKPSALLQPPPAPNKDATS